MPEPHWWPEKFADLPVIRLRPAPTPSGHPDHDDPAADMVAIKRATRKLSRPWRRGVPATAIYDALVEAIGDPHA